MSSAPQLPPPPPHSRTSSLAIISLVSGILGWSALPFIGSVVAIITGHLARSEIRRDSLEGDGLALAGLVLGYVMVAVAVLSILALLLFFGGLAAFFAFAHQWS